MIPGTALTPIAPATVARWRREYPDALIVFRLGSRRVVCWPPGGLHPAGQVEHVTKAYAVAAVIVAAKSGRVVTYIDIEPEGQS